jgi:hypothetical protein
VRVQQGQRVPCDAPALLARRPLAVLAERDVVGDRQVAGERRLLVDHLDAETLDDARLPAQRDLLAVERHRPALRAQCAGGHVDERRLPGAVVAEEPDDLTWAHAEGLVDQGHRRPEGHVDALQRDEGRRLCVRSGHGHDRRAPRGP